MATVACPGCGLPQVEAEVGSTPCPVCHAAPSAVEGPRAAKEAIPDPADALPADASELYAPAPNRARQGAGGGLPLVGAVAFLIGALCGVGGLLGVQALNRPAPQPAQPEVAELPKLEAPVPAVPPRKPAVPEVAPMPHEFVARPVAKVEPEPAGEFQLPDPLPPPGVVTTHVINRPDDAYPVPTLKKGEHIILKGKVKTLRVHGLDAGSVLDASGLEASVITVTGKIDNRSTLKLKAPNGVVHVAGKVAGGSAVEVVAPEGEVRFLLPTSEKREGSKIDGGASVAVTARWVEFKGDITGNNTKVAVTLTRNAILKVASVGGRATVEYRAQPGGLSPDVIVGDVARTALFRKVQ